MKSDEIFIYYTIELYNVSFSRLIIIIGKKHGIGQSYVPTEHLKSRDRLDIRYFCIRYIFILFLNFMIFYIIGYFYAILPGIRFCHISENVASVPSLLEYMWSITKIYLKLKVFFKKLKMIASKSVFILLNTYAFRVGYCV